jgi:hypothetical protein
VGVLRVKAWLASLITLGVAIVIALAVYSMPVGQAGDAAIEGAVWLRRRGRAVRRRSSPASTALPAWAPADDHYDH